MTRYHFYVILVVMSDFKEALRNLDPGLMYDAAISVGSGISSPDGEDSLSKLGQYPAFATIAVGLNERFQTNSNLSPAERRMLLLGVLTCLETLADYANAEELRNSVSGE